MQLIQSLRRRALPALLLGGLALAAPTSAQTLLTGNVFDGSGGPLLAGQVYHAGGVLTVPAGQTLTVQAGAILKFASSRITVNGVLDVNGTAASRAVFTSLLDDTAGGDTNADGPSVGTPGDWQGIVVGGTGTLNADDLSARFAGQSGFTTVYQSGGSITLTSCELRDSSSAGIDLNTLAAPVTVSGCSFLNNAGRAVDEVNIDLLSGFSNNTASGNGGDYLFVSDTSPVADVLIKTENLLGDVVVFNAISTVPAGVTLTLEAGVILKWSTAARFVANGTLRLLGEPGAEVVLTSFADDDHGGDTNGDGLSSGAPADWQGIVSGSTGALEMENAVVRYAGSSGWTPVYSSGGTISVKRSELRDSSGAAIDLNNTNVVPTIAHCLFTGNLGVAVIDVTIDAATGFRSNTAKGNGGDYMLLSDTSPLADVTLNRENTLGGVLVFNAVSTIPSGVKLTIGQGVIIKWSATARLVVNGELELLGTHTSEVVLTSFDDDTFGGDTNADGPSSGTPGDWQGLVVASTGTAHLQNAIVAYPGSSGWAPLYVTGGSVSARDCIFRDSSGAGVDLNGLTSPVKLVRCSIVDNGGIAVQEASLEALTGFADNVASGNASGDYIRVTDPSPAVDVHLGVENCLNRTLVFTAVSTIPAGVRLTLDRGVIVKWGVAARMDVNGALDLLGTAFEPVVFTSIADDELGGDTNADGPSAGLAGDWQGLDYNPAAATSLAENVLVRFAGSSGWSAIACDSPNVELRSVRAEHASARGIVCGQVSGLAANWVAFDCGGDGIELTAGAFDLVHATSTANGGWGIQGLVAYSGQVVSSIAWANGTGEYDGFGAGRLQSSNGSAAHAGSSGNLNVDPLFVDPSAAAGDLNLQAASLCVDSADTATAMAVVKDHAENSRLLDPTLSGAVSADMGAYERARWTMKVAGEPRVGSVLKLRVAGSPGTSTYMLGLLDGVSFSAPFGFTTAGGASLFSIGQLPVGATLGLRVPDAASLIGLEVGLQTMTTPIGSPALGAMTNLYRAKILGPKAETSFQPVF